jgi:hypothetical protein
VALGDTQVGHQKGDRLGPHDPAAVGMNGELAGGNLVFAEYLFTASDLACLGKPVGAWQRLAL